MLVKIIKNLEILIPLVILTVINSLLFLQVSTDIVCLLLIKLTYEKGMSISNYLYLWGEFFPACTGINYALKFM